MLGTRHARLLALLAAPLLCGGCEDEAVPAAQAQEEDGPPAADDQTGSATPPEGETDPVEEEAAPPEPAAPPSNLAVWPGDNPPPNRGDRIYSKVRHLWIRPQPRNSKAWIGYLSLGDAIPVKGGDAKQAYAGKGQSRGCEAWYAVEPSGYVCVGEDATLDGGDPTVVELMAHAADRSSPWPYRYGESLQVPVYHQLPSPEKQLYREAALTGHLQKVKAAQALPVAEREDRFEGVDLSPGEPTPPKLLDLPAGGRALATKVHLGSTLAYTKRFEHAGRTFLMTWDRGYVPADKVKPYPQSDFAGVKLGGENRLPLAWFRGEARPKFQKSGASFAQTDQQWPRLAHVGLTGREEEVDGVRYLETREPGMWVRAADTVVTARSEDLPPQIARADEGHRTWLDISVLKGTLVAYENRTPVYATLISPGRGGIPRRGVPPLDTASTPTGVFSVLAKFVTATMVSGSVSTLVHAEVQYTQNFSGPYALHGAYWHDDWGNKKSGGCINLSPRDAQRVFEWTHPRLPDGWHGMRTITKGAHFEQPTLLYVHR